MKRFITLVSLLLLMGCVSGLAKFTIPDAPITHNFEAHQVAGGVCIDYQNLHILLANMQAMESYANELRKILEDQQEDKRLK